MMIFVSSVLLEMKLDAYPLSFKTKYVLLLFYFILFYFLLHWAFVAHELL